MANFHGTLVGHLATNFGNKSESPLTRKKLQSLDSIIAVIFSQL
jgi:hypothetical protein